MTPLLMENKIFKRLVHVLGKTALFLMGWHTKGKMPDLKKCILVAAPHSTNWDFVFFLLIVFKLGIPSFWMGKAAMFIHPFKGLLKQLGGIPVDRSSRHNLVDLMAKQIRKSDRMILTIAPSGTRRQVGQWKTGFYHIAVQAKIPIVCGFIDYPTKTGGIGPVFFPTGNADQDICRIQDFYKDKTGKKQASYQS